MDKCKDCKFYDPLEILFLYESRWVDRIGKCTKLIDIELDAKRKDGIYLEEGEEQIIVGEDFGCIHFERREE